MDKAELSRRQVLAGLAVTGSSGALVGSGTGAVFSDDETFTNNSLTGSEAAAGIVDMAVKPTVSDDDQSVEFEVDLPQAEDEIRNPAFVCVSGVDCPGSADADEIRVVLELECYDTSGTTEKKGKSEIILVGSLREVLDVLGRGILLDCSDEENVPCLKPGADKVKLILRVDDSFSGDVGDYSFTFNLNFFSKQCRSSDLSSNPALLESPCPVANRCPSDSSDISFIAFCFKKGKDIQSKPRIYELETKKGTAVSVLWETPEPVDYVIVFDGGCWVFYDYTGGNYRRGVATTRDKTASDKFLYSNSNSGCENLADGSLKEAIEDQEDNTGDSFDNYCQGNGRQSCPCAVAEFLFKGTDFQGTSFKYDAEKKMWE